MSLLHRINNRDSYNEWDSFRKTIEEHPDLKIFLFGSGSQSLLSLEILQEKHYEIKGIIDNNKDILGETRSNVKIYSFKEFLEKSGNTVVIITDSYIKEKTEQIRNAGLTIPIFSPALILNYITGLDADKVFGHMDEFRKTYNMLEDEESKRVMGTVLKAAICSSYKPFFEIFTTPLYFPDEIYPKNIRSFLDVGAADGDTIEAFIRCNKEYDFIYAFEAMNNLREKIKNKKFKNLIIFPYGAGSKKEELILHEVNSAYGKSVSSYHRGKEIRVAMNSIDNCVGSNQIDFIKMDIEGGEENALIGGRNVIIRDKPFLAISVYHKWDDLIRIPECINRMCPGYRFYLRHHTLTPTDTVLYAVYKN